MTTQGPNPGSALGPGWTSGNLVFASDDQYPAGFANPGIIKGFNFSIPDGATINSILVAVESHFENPLDSYGVRLTKDGVSAIGSTVSISPAGLFDNVENAGPGLFGTTWTAAEINSSSFGVALIPGALGEFGGDWFVDFVSVTVDYTDASIGEPRRSFSAQNRQFSHNSKTRNFIFDSD